MKLLSEYMSDDGKKTSKVYYETKEQYIVITGDDLGNFFRSEFATMQTAENYAEDWVL